ncbi:PH domain-containing protein [uncultured Winogradskyella sp.]|uniref:PH domain-containing protein n=1 Tax=uncultured Winogradskyella sp. TaxID=395353 RepID=UPI0030DD031F|tara:strand:+ start:53133 stop:53657 length:525 start_codon:yes stop_codon:yes gene_type:complete
MMPFTNNQIDIAMLPKVEDVILESISPKYFRILIFNTVILYALFIASITILSTFVDSDSFLSHVFWYLTSILIISCLIQIFIYKLGFKKRKYALREQDIIYSHGFFNNETTTLPFNRIQHIEISRTFIERKIGLSTLKIFSAGESGGDISIKGLPRSIADAQYAFLTKILNDRL